MSMPPSEPDRGQAWRWWVCCLLLLATMINYMDRLTLNLLAAPHHRRPRPRPRRLRQHRGRLRPRLRRRRDLSSASSSIAGTSSGSTPSPSSAGPPPASRPGSRATLRAAPALPRPARLRGVGELALRPAHDAAHLAARRAVDGQQHPAIRGRPRGHPHPAGHVRAVRLGGARDLAQAVLRRRGRRGRLGRPVVVQRPPGGPLPPTQRRWRTRSTRSPAPGSPRICSSGATPSSSSSSSRST